MFYRFSQHFNLGLVYIDNTSFGFSTVFETFYAEILVLTSVMIHIQATTGCGLMDSSLNE